MEKSVDYELLKKYEKIIEEEYPFINSLCTSVLNLDNLNESVKHIYIKNEYINALSKALPYEKVKQILVDYFSKYKKLVLPDFFTSNNAFNNYDNLATNVMDGFDYYVDRLFKNKDEEYDFIRFNETVLERFDFLEDRENRKKALEYSKRRYEDLLDEIDYIYKIFPKEFYDYKKFIEAKRKLIDFYSENKIMILDALNFDDYSNYLRERLEEKLCVVSLPRSYILEHSDEVSSSVIDKCNRLSDAYFFINPESLQSSNHTNMI